MSPPRRWCGSGAALVAAWLLLGASAPHSRSLEAFDEAVAEITEDCRTRASTVCVDLAWRTADVDGDGRLTVNELEQVHRQFDEWPAGKRPGLAPEAANAISNGSRLVAAVGLGRLVAAFDADGDGRLTPDEAFSEIELDERPLGVVLSDPDSVDRPTLSRRLAAASPLLAALIAGVPLHRP